MKIRNISLALALLISPALGQASDNPVTLDLFTLWALQQAAATGSIPPELPKDILDVVGGELRQLECNGVRIHQGKRLRWVSFVDPVAFMAAFRDSAYPDEVIEAVLQSKECIKKALLRSLSDQWRVLLKDLLKEPRQDHETWSSAKAYGAGLLALYTIDQNATWNAAGKAAWEAAGQSDGESAATAAYFSAWKAFEDATAKIACEDAWKASARVTASASNAAFEGAEKAVRFSLAKKLESLRSSFGSHFASRAYELAELFALLWLNEHGETHRQKAFAAAYEQFPMMEFDKVKDTIEAAINTPELKDNTFTEALRRDLTELEKAVLARVGFGS